MQDEPCRKPVLESKQIYQGKVFSFYTDRVQLNPDEAPAVRDYLRHPGAVAIVALRPKDAKGKDLQILLVRQYRHPVGACLWEVPAGLLDHEGEDPLSAAQRELLEEADLQAKDWKVLVDIFSSPGCSQESLRIFLATHISEVPEENRYQRIEEEAEMVSRWFDLSEVKAAIHAGKIHNPATVVGVLAADSARQEGWANLRPPTCEWMR